jgi:hypothetical protein
MSEFNFSFPITMLGPRSVGKTSMIASMRNEFDRVCNNVALQLVPDPTTGTELNRAMEELKRMCACRVGEYPRPTIKQTVKHSEYTLELYHVSSEAAMRVVFHDYPGEWLRNSTGRVHELLSQAAIILVALDVPALMDLDDDQHEELNQPADISDALARAFKDDNADVRERIVLFVPMRGEKWLQNGEPEAIWQKFRKRFASAERTLKAHQKRVSVAFLPIQTLGAVHYAGYNWRKRESRFQKVHAEYCPAGCDQPLRYSLSYMLRMMARMAESQGRDIVEVIAKRGLAERLYMWAKCLLGGRDVESGEMARWFERSKELLEAISDFATGCRQDPPFLIIQDSARLLSD